MALLSEALILAYVLPILTVCSSLGGKIYAYIFTRKIMLVLFSIKHHDVKMYGGEEV
jgi:hypothetical protein